jgi:lysophospholipase L1-like esterase
MATSVTPILGFYCYDKLINQTIKGLYVDVNIPEYPAYNGYELVNNGQDDLSVKYRSKSWLAIGDSLTAFYGSYGDGKPWDDNSVDVTDQGSARSTYGSNYVSFVEAETGHKALRKSSGQNYGHSGYALGCSAGQTHQTLYDAKSEWSSLKPELITLFAGTNDYRYEVDLGTMEDYLNSTGISTFYGALRLYIDAFRAKNDVNNRVEIVLITPVQRFSDSNTIHDANTKGHYLEDYANAMKTVGAYESLTVVDLYHDGGISSSNYTKLLFDKLHPNKQGSEIIANRICRAIK